MQYVVNEPNEDDGDPNETWYGDIEELVIERETEQAMTIVARTFLALMANAAAQTQKATESVES